MLMGEKRALKPIVFIGFMGAGKSGAASKLGGALGLEVVDIDNLIVEETGMSIDQFFDEKGESEFREIEERISINAIKPMSVTATGGGAVLSDEIRAMLHDSLCIYLDIPKKMAWRRVKGSNRPLIRDKQRFFELHAERKELYESVANVFIPSRAVGSVTKLTPLVEQMAEEGLPESTKVALAVTESAEYPVVLADELVSKIGMLWDSRKAFIVSDSNTAPLYFAKLADQLGEHVAGTCVIEAGEEHKTMSQAESVLREMATAKLTRSDCVVALGGGVVGDLAGFCASTYQRGIDVIQIPTTLVAQVDSAYGGKTGVDLPEAKNYVGTFHQPTAVYVDPGLLVTLPKEDLSSGYAEVVKTALIAGGNLWARVQDEVEPEKLVFDCLRLKLDVVGRDELDTGVRAVLNLGHTVGHAIETATGYEKYRHGEAVAIGLCAALELSERTLGLDEGIRVRVSELLDSRGLALKCEDVSASDLKASLAYDKKRRGGASNWVLLAAPGDVRIDHEVDDDVLLEVIDAVSGGGSS